MNFHTPMWHREFSICFFLGFVCCILCIWHVLLTLVSMFLLTARGIRYQASATRIQIHRPIYPSQSWPPDLIKYRYKCTLKHPPLHLDSGEVFKWVEISYSSNWHAVAHRRPGNTMCECTSSEHLASVWQAVHCLHFSSFLQLEAGFILQYSGATESWLLINRPPNNCWLWARPSWARGTGSKLMPALDSFMVAWKVFTFAAKYQTYVNMTTRTL